MTVNAYNRILVVRLAAVIGCEYDIVGVSAPADSTI
jgi:hypothetical protein